MLCITMLCSINAYAYIDTSVATYIIQIIAGIGVTLGVLLSVFRYKINLMIFDLFGYRQLSCQDSFSL